MNVRHHAIQESSLLGLQVYKSHNVISKLQPCFHFFPFIFSGCWPGRSTFWQFDHQGNISSHQSHRHVDSWRCFVFLVGTVLWCSDSCWVWSTETPALHLHAFFLEKFISCKRQKECSCKTDVGKSARGLWWYWGHASSHAWKWSNKVLKTKVTMKPVWNGPDWNPYYEQSLVLHCVLLMWCYVFFVLVWF